MTITADGRFIVHGREVETTEEIRDTFVEWCKTWNEEAKEHRRKQVYGLNTALAHIEGRRAIFSTRDPKTVVTILRDALGSEVNEERGKGAGGYGF